MIFPLSRRAPSRVTISALYGTIVAQARLLIFYRDYGVPDTLDGRFELLVLHLFLLLRRLELNGDGGRTLGQHVFNLFCRDMDQNLREIGIGDLKVPKEMRRIGEAFYGRTEAYSAALAGTRSLADVLARNVFGATETADSRSARRLATYVKDAAERLAAQPTSRFNDGSVRFPEP